MSAPGSARIHEENQSRPPQQQSLPGDEHKMDPAPVFITPSYKGSNKLKGKVAVITGADSGIGRATAVHFAREGADVAIFYLNEHKDAEDTRSLVQNEGRKCEIYPGDVGDFQWCKDAVSKVVQKFGHIDILVNNAAEQHECESIEDITPEQLERTFRTNIFGYFYMAQLCVPHMSKERGGNIINMTSINAFRGHKTLIDYSSTKGAIVAFSRSLAQSLAERGIRVNAVAPGPIWTPLVAASFKADKMPKFGESTLMHRAGQPAEVATCCVFLASDDSSYITGDIINPNGGAMMVTLQ